MPVVEKIPYYEPGARVSFLATANVTAGRLLDVSATPAEGPGLNTGTGGGNIKMAHASSGGKAIGWCTPVDVASGKIGTAVMLSAGFVVPCYAGADITAGAVLQVGSSGQVITRTSGIPIGVALNTVTSGNDVMMIMLPHLATAGDLTPQSAITALTDNTTGTANNTLAAIPNPSDSPATADALRDDIVTNVLPPIRDDLADLAAKVNAILTALQSAGVTS